MMTSITKNKTGKNLKKVLIAIVWVTIWQVLYWIVNKEMLIASPLRVFIKIVELMVKGEFWIIVFMTVLRILTGFSVAIAVGIPLAILTVKSPLAYDFLYPIISVIKATPVASFIILALVWIDTGNIPGFIAFLMVLPIVWSNVSAGILNTDSKLLEMGESFQFSRWKKIRFIYVPSVMPYFVSAVTTGIGIAWKSGVAAEVISMPKRSIGAELYYSKIYIETTDLFAWTIVVVIVSMIIEKALVSAIKKLNFKGTK